MNEKPWYLTPAEEGYDWPSRPRVLSELGLDSLQRARVLEWFAVKIWVAQNEGIGDPDYGGKSYDPLTVELDTSGGGTAHSYVFSFRDGGRHHPFHSLDELEEFLTEEAIGTVKWAVGRGKEDAVEALAREIWLEEGSGQAEDWNGLQWSECSSFYARAQKRLESV